ncbi:chemotaxis protein CheW [Thiohalophilus sp.]|uniref:chemotaxis protein CheW n=1 Tax=Thiohalophilus sp. TaxID=3028392 RepID=UPI0039753038
MASLHDADALLIYEVGPVRCCAPTGPIEQIVLPPELTHPPGSDAARPGIFRHGQHLVSVIDLRQRFGIDPANWLPGRLVITQLARGYTGFWVDRIVDVIRYPAEGWGGLPPHLPRDTFSRTLLYREQIHLYTEFEQLPHLHPAGFLRQYLAHLEPAAQNPNPKAPPASEHQLHGSQTGVRPASETTSLPAADTRSEPEPVPAPAVPSPANKPTETRPNTDSAGPVPPQTATSCEPRQPDTPAPSPQTFPVTEPSTPARTRPPAQPIAAGGAGKPSTHSPASTKPGTHSAGRQPVPRPASPTPPVAKAVSPPPGPSISKSPSAPLAEDTGGGLGVLLVLLLLLGGGAVGIYLWYPTGDIPDPVADLVPDPIPDPIPETFSDPSASPPVLSASAPEPMSERPSHSSSAREPFAPAPPTERPYAEPAPKPKPVPEPDTKAAPQLPAIAESPPHVLGGLIRTAPPYRASIEQSSEGITLIFEAPAPAIPAVTIPPGEPADEAGPQGATLKQSADEQTDAPASNTPPDREDIVHVVARGDTLWDIAKKYVDNPWRYPELAENSDIHNPDLIYPGDRVRIIIYRGQRP